MAITTNLDNFDLPYIISLRKRDEIVDKVESDRGVMYGIVPLEEIPERNSGISIDGFTRVQDGTDLGVNQFRVDYANGLVFVNPDIYPDGSTLPTIRYRGKGVILISADRVFLPDGSGRTLGDVNLNFDEKLDKDFTRLPRGLVDDLDDEDLFAIYDVAGQVVASLTLADLRAGVQKVFQNTYDLKETLIATGKINPIIKDRGQLVLDSQGAGINNSVWENDGRPNIIEDGTFLTMTELVTTSVISPEIKLNQYIVEDAEGFGLNNKIWRNNPELTDREGWYNTGLTTDEDGWFNTQQSATVSIELVLAIDTRVKELEEKTVGISHDENTNTTVLTGVVSVDTLNSDNGIFDILESDIITFTNINGQVGSIDTLTVGNLVVNGLSGIDVKILANETALTNITYAGNEDVYEGGETIITGFTLLSRTEAETALIKKLTVEGKVENGFVTYIDVGVKLTEVDELSNSNGSTLTGFNTRISRVENEIGIDSAGVPLGSGLRPEVEELKTDFSDLNSKVNNDKANLQQIVEDPSIIEVEVDGVQREALTSNRGLNESVINSMSIDDEQLFNIKLGTGLEAIDDVSPNAPANTKILNVTISGGEGVGSEVFKGDIVNSDVSYPTNTKTNIPYDTIDTEIDSGITWNANSREFIVEKTGTIFIPKITHNLRKTAGNPATMVFRLEDSSGVELDTFNANMEDTDTNKSVTYAFRDITTTQDNEVYTVSFECDGDPLIMNVTSTQRLTISITEDSSQMNKSQYVDNVTDNILPAKIDGIGAGQNITDTHLGGQVQEIDTSVGNVRVPYPELPATTTTAEGKFNYLRDITNAHRDNINDNIDAIDRVSDFAELKIREHDLSGVVNTFTQDLLGENTIEDGSVISATLVEASSGSVSGATTFVNIGGNTDNSGVGVRVLDEYGNDIPATKYLDKLVELRYSQDLSGGSQVFVLRNLYTASTYNATFAGFDWIVSRRIKLIEDDVIEVRFLETDYSIGGTRSGLLFVEFINPDGTIEVLTVRHSESNNTDLMRNQQVNGETIIVKRTLDGLVVVGNPPMRSISSAQDFATHEVYNGEVISKVENLVSGATKELKVTSSGVFVDGEEFNSSVWEVAQRGVFPSVTGELFTCEPNSRYKFIITSNNLNSPMAINGNTLINTLYRVGSSALDGNGNIQLTTYNSNTNPLDFPYEVDIYTSNNRIALSAEYNGLEQGDISRQVCSAYQSGLTVYNGTPANAGQIVNWVLLKMKK